MRRAGALLALAVSVGACAKQSGHDAATPAFAAPGMSLDEYERMLTQNEVALRQQGVRVPPSRTSGTKVALAEKGRENNVETAPRGDGADLDATAGEDDASAVGGATISEEEAAPEAAPARPAPFPASEDAAEPEYGPKSESQPRRSSRQQRGVREQAPDRCEMICDLAAATCDLEAKICALASEHPRDPRYQNACERASRDCEIAQEACLECAE